MSPWPSHRAPGIGGRRKARMAFAAGNPEQTWRTLILAVRTCVSGEVGGPGVWEALGVARSACAGAPFPVDGEDAKAAAHCLLEMARTWHKAGEDQRGWHAASTLALAEQCEARLGQAANSRTRSMTGERD